MEITCYKCQATITLNTAHVPRKEECPSCYTDLHSCKACHFYDKSSYNECREPTADRIVEKEKANFCDHFKVNTKASNQKEETENLLSLAESLFKK